MIKVPFAKAVMTHVEEDAVLKVLRSGWLTSGSEMAGFESELSAWLGEGVQSIAVSSATAGLHLALEACGVKRGDHVLVPTWTFTATAEVIEYVGAVPIFVDVERSTMNVTVDLLEEARTPLTRAVIVVHFAGVPCDMRAIWEWAKSHDLVVIEDAAHALGSWVEGKPVGAGESDATVFSFYATKCITTGEGGAVVTKYPGVASRMKTMRLHGINSPVFDRYTSNSAKWEYDVVAAGFKYNLPDILAAIGRVQLHRMEDMRLLRQRVALRYDRLLIPLAVIRPVPASTIVSHHLYVIRVADRDRVIEEMHEQGIGCSVHFKPLHRMSYWGPKARGEFIGADTAFEECLSLPIYPTLTEAQQSQVVEALSACVR